MIATGCGAPPDPGASEGGAGTAERTSALTVGAQRIIPIRAVLVRQSHDEETPSQTPYTPLEIEERKARLLTVTNEVWRPTGVRFSIESVRQIVEPYFAYGGSNTKVPYSPALKARLEALLGPSVSVWASDPAMGTPYGEDEWLAAAVLKFGAKNAMYAFFAMESPSGGCNSWHRGCLLAGTNNEFGNNLHVAHEFGHAFDLGEVGELFHDPVTGLPQTREDMWDMFYCPGTSAASPHRYYTSWVDSLTAPPCTAPGGRAAIAAGANLSHCQPNVLTSCTGPVGAPLPVGQYMCALEGAAGPGYCEVKNHGSAALYNSITFSAPDASGTLYGPNIMSYADGAHYSMSPSQVRVVRDKLRYDRLVAEGPLAFDPSPPWGGKPRLGMPSPRTALPMIDFNGDGKRDLASFITRRGDSIGQTGDWSIRSSTSFLSGPPVRKFGQLDDIPVPGLYDDGNDITDQAVYRPGGSGSGAATDPSLWGWCPSGGNTTPPDCSSGGWGGATFGTREDVPLPGLNLGPGRYLAVYRPSNGTFYWTRIGVWTVFSVQVAQPNTPSFPMAGLYDADDLIDFATYDPYTARFDLVLSTAGWSPANRRVRVFDPQYRPTPSATVGWPVVGIRRALPIAGNPVREVFAVYDPNSGRTDVAWDVLTVTSSPYTATTTSVPNTGQHVLGGITGTPAPYDAVIGIEWGSPAKIRISAPDAAGNFSSSTAVSTGLTIRNDNFVGIVRDVTGDNVPDLIVHDGQNANITILASPSFTTAVPIPLGGPFAQLL